MRPIHDATSSRISPGLSRLRRERSRAFACHRPAAVRQGRGAADGRPAVHARRASCSSPAKAASARRRSPARRRRARRRGPARAARQHRSRVEPRRGARRVARRAADARAGGARPLRAEHRPGSGGARLSRARRRAVPRRAARRGRRAASRSSSPARAPSRSRRSTSSPSCSAIRATHRATSTTSSSTRRRPGTRCACWSCPAAWTGFLDANPAGTSCLGPLAGLQAQQRALRASLRGARATPSARRSCSSAAPSVGARGSGADAAPSSPRSASAPALVSTASSRATDASDPIARALEARGRDALAALPAALAALPRTERPAAALRRSSGVDALRRSFSGAARVHASAVRRVSGDRRDPPAPSPTLVDEIERAGRGVVHDDGQGRRRQDDHRRGDRRRAGAARATACTSRRPIPPRTSPTPSARACPTCASAASIRPRRRARTATRCSHARRRRSTPRAARCSRRICARPAPRRSPSSARSRAPSPRASDGFVVIDTAPTGHTLLLLDAAEAYHREVLAHARATRPTRCAACCRACATRASRSVLLVTLPEATPVHEAAQLRRTCGARRSSRSPGSSIRASPVTASATRAPRTRRPRGSIPHGGARSSGHAASRGSPGIRSRRSAPAAFSSLLVAVQIVHSRSRMSIDQFIDREHSTPCAALVQDGPTPVKSSSA